MEGDFIQLTVPRTETSSPEEPKRPLNRHKTKPALFPKWNRAGFAIGSV